VVHATYDLLMELSYKYVERWLENGRSDERKTRIVFKERDPAISCSFWATQTTW
jgi:hypothetical protein